MTDDNFILETIDTPKYNRLYYRLRYAPGYNKDADWDYYCLLTDMTRQVYREDGRIELTNSSINFITSEVTHTWDRAGFDEYIDYILFKCALPYEQFIDCLFNDIYRTTLPCLRHNIKHIPHASQ